MLDARPPPPPAPPPLRPYCNLPGGRCATRQLRHHRDRPHWIQTQDKGATAAGQWWSSLKKEGRGSVWPLGIRPNTTLRSFASCAVSDHECPRADGRSALVGRPLKMSCASMNRYTSVAAAAPAGAGHCPAWTSRPAQPRPIERAIGQRHRSTTSVLSLLGRGTGGGGSGVGGEGYASWVSMGDRRHPRLGCAGRPAGTAPPRCARRGRRADAGGSGDLDAGGGKKVGAPWAGAPARQLHVGRPPHRRAGRPDDRPGGERRRSAAAAALAGQPRPTRGEARGVAHAGATANRPSPVRFGTGHCYGPRGSGGGGGGGGSGAPPEAAPPSLQRRSWRTPSRWPPAGRAAREKNGCSPAAWPRATFRGNAGWGERGGGRLPAVVLWRGVVSAAGFGGCPCHL